MDISVFTASSYIRRIFAKSEVNSRAAMVASAIENDLCRRPAAGRVEIGAVSRG